jgi:hypothetical protein
MQPTVLTSAVAEQITSDHVAAARAHRATRSSGSVRFARFRGRRSGASQAPLPRGRTVPPFAH